MMNPLSYGISMLGRWSPRINSLNALLTVSELPGNGWRILDERTWKFSEFPNLKKGETTDRAVKAGGFIAWRSFKRNEPYSGLWVQINPYASVQDAEASIPDNLSQFSKNPAFEGEVGEERPIGEFKLPGIEHATFFERSTSGGRGNSTTRVVCGNVHNAVFVLACSVTGEGLPWEAMISIATKQVKKIEERLAKNH
jgi:hypothetical protein